MSRLPVFSENAAGDLVAMQPAEPLDEAELQALIAAHPETIAGTGEPLVLVRREQGVPDQLDGSNRFSLDNLFVTRSGVPVLVEVKRATNTQLRREVVGQLLDYAANGSAYWQPGTLEAEFRAQCERDGLDPDEVLREFLPEAPGGDTGEAGDPRDDFWSRVDANLAAGTLRLVVVADTVPSQLARVIEFLNEQMRATVLAVELTYYRAQGGRRTLVPKVIGETERVQAAKTSAPRGPHGVTLDDWMATNAVPRGQTHVRACRTLFDLVAGLGGSTEVASNPKELYFFWPNPAGKFRFRPLYSTVGGKIGLCFPVLGLYDAFASEDARAAVYKRMSDAVGGLSTDNLNGYPSFPVDRLLDDKTASRFADVLQSIVEQARATG